MTRTPDHKDQQKKFGWSGITSFYFPAHMNMAIFGHFFTIQSQEVERTTIIIFILKDL